MAGKEVLNSAALLTQDVMKRGFHGLEILPSDIVTTKELFPSMGALGFYVGFYKDEEVAVKLPQTEHLSEQELEEFKLEVQTMSLLSHPNIVRFLGACLQPSKFNLVMELPKGDLGALIAMKKNEWSLYRKLRLAQDVCKGMIFVHQHGLVLQNLQPANLWYDATYTMKIGDAFGRFNPRYFGKYMAPEVFLRMPPTDKSDVYSFGLILWFIFTGLEPYSHLMTETDFMTAVVHGGERPPLPIECPPRLANLIQLCWHRDATQRPAFLALDAELHNIMLEAAIPDPVGRAMWSEAFPRKEEIAWDEFVRAFYKSILALPVPEDYAAQHPVTPEQRPQLPLETQIMYLTDAELEEYLPRATMEQQFALIRNEMLRRDALQKLDCFKLLLASPPTYTSIAEEVVDIEKFGHICSLFGPIDPAQPVQLLVNIHSLANRDWFYGTIDKDEAFHMLKDKESGTFLVRFSSNPVQAAFVISLVNERKVIHLRVHHVYGRGFCLAGSNTCARSLEDLITANMRGLLRKVCPPTKKYHSPAAVSKNLKSTYVMVALDDAQHQPPPAMPPPH